MMYIGFMPKPRTANRRTPYGIFRPPSIRSRLAGLRCASLTLTRRASAIATAEYDGPENREAWREIRDCLRSLADEYGVPIEVYAAICDGGHMLTLQEPTP
jgi:hypothetical protein